MPKLSPREAREKHARNLKNSTQDIQRGIERVAEAPGKRAASKVQKMRQNLLASIDDGTWESRVGSVSLEDWKTAAVEKGVGRIAAGIDGAAAKVESFYEQLFPHQESIQRELEGMPDLTLEDNIQRMTHAVRRMAEFKRE